MEKNNQYQKRKMGSKLGVDIKNMPVGEEKQLRDG